MCSIVEHPHLELTPVHVFGAEKIGVEAGELCGLGATATSTSGCRLRSAMDPSQITATMTD